MIVYLPIAELPVSVLLIMAMGMAVGFVSGMFGIGGGFLMTPLLIFVGIPPAVSVATVTTHIAASSFSGVLSYWRRKALDVRLGATLLIGGFMGTALGVWLFGILQRNGQLELVIALSYVVLLSAVGSMMLAESIKVMTRRGLTVSDKPKSNRSNWAQNLPLQFYYSRSEKHISIIPIIAIGFLIGFLGAVLGIGGGFLLVPALIYILRIPTSVVVGTSLMLTLVTMLMAVIMHAASNASVDAVLALLLMIGGVVGAQFGVRTGQKLKAEQLRFLLGTLVLIVGLRFAYDVIITPDDIFSLRLVTPL